MALNHDIPMAGHHGKSRTIELVKERYFLHRMSRNIVRYVSECSRFAVSKKPVRKPRGEMVLFYSICA